MERRFKVIGVSIEIVASYGKKFQNALLEQLAPGADILLTKEDLFLGTLFCLIYHPGFPKLEPKEAPPNLEFEMKPKKASSILTFQ